MAETRKRIMGNHRGPSADARDSQSRTMRLALAATAIGMIIGALAGAAPRPAPQPSDAATRQPTHESYN